jgi:hypothetical protein
MADFDLEQLKSLFENLGDRLDKTSGDKMSREELAKIKALLAAQGRKADKAPSATDPKDFVKEFFKEWGAKDPLKDLRATGGSKSDKAPTRVSGTDGNRRGTLINEERARRGATEGLTLLERESRRTAGTTKTFGDATGKAGKNLDAFGAKTGGAAGGFATAAGLAGKFFGSATGAILDRADYYRQILASGEGTVDSIQDMGRQAAAAGMTVKDFAESMSQGTQGARLMGAIKFAQLNKGINDMTRGAGAMGMTVEQIRDAGQDYAELLRIQGNSRETDMGKLTNGMFQMVRSSEATANILGLTRKEAMDLAKQNASNTNVQGSMEAKGYTSNQVQASNDLSGVFAQQYGEAGKTLINDLIQYGQPMNKAATDLAALMPEVAQQASQSVANIANNSAIDVKKAAYQNAQGMQQVGAEFRADRNRLGSLSAIAGLEAGPLSAALTAGIAGTQNVRNMNTNERANAGTEQENGSKERDASSGILQIDGAAYQIDVVKDAAITAFVNPMVSVFGPVLKDTVLPNLRRFNDGLIAASMSLEKQTGPMAALGGTAMAVAAGMVAFSSALSIMNTAKNLGILGGGAGAGAGGAGAGGAGATGALGSLFKGISKGKGGLIGAGIGTAFEAKDYVTGEKEASGSNLGKSALNVGGAALGGVLGSLLGPLGTIAGGTAGSYAGEWAGNKIFGEDTPKPADARGNNRTSQQVPSVTANGDPQNKRPVQSTNPVAPVVVRTPQAPQARATPVDASGQRSKNSLSATQMSQKIMEAGDRTANYLKSLNEHSGRQADLMREEITVLRTMSDRVSRLLEDGNKNTRSIADHSA